MCVLERQASWLVWKRAIVMPEKNLFWWIDIIRNVGKVAHMRTSFLTALNGTLSDRSVSNFVSANPTLCVHIRRQCRETNSSLRLANGCIFFSRDNYIAITVTERREHVQRNKIDNRYTSSLHRALYREVSIQLARENWITNRK